jgi:hypothetical protein
MSKKKKNIPYVKIIVASGVLITLMTGGKVTVITGDVENVTVTSHKMKSALPVLFDSSIIDTTEHLGPIYGPEEFDEFDAKDFHPPLLDSSINDGTIVDTTEF